MNKLVNVFDPRANALNAVRLGLSVGVIIYHSFPLTGFNIHYAPVDQLLGSFFVDAFFAISGYLIVSSWTRRPHWWPFLRARLLRIMPAFYLSSLMTAFVIAPIAILIGGLGLPVGFHGDAASYVIHNGLLRVHQYDIAGTPLGVPYPHAWNGSIWTLWWEFLCYLGVLLLGLARVLRWRATIVVLFGMALIAFVATAYGPVHQYYIDNGARFGLMFLAGSMVYTFRDRLPASWPLVGLAGAIVMASAWLPDYRLTAALPIAYVVIVSGALAKDARLWLPNDISYGTYIYAFPLQQLLASAGLDKAGVPVFAIVSVVATLPVAAASWFAVERPALKLKTAGRTKRPSSSAGTDPRTDGEPVSTAPDPVVRDGPAPT